MNLSDYLIEQQGIDRGTFLSCWAELLPPSFTVWLVNRFGDVFAIYDDGSVHMLDVSNGTVQRCANSRDEFADLVDRDDNADHWLLLRLVDRCVAAGLTLSAGQCYAFKMLPFLGGEYTPGNVYAIAIESCYPFLADIFQQTKDLPNGSQVKIVVTNAPSRNESDPNATLSQVVRCYSYRSALVGCTCAARCAGIRIAMAAVTASTSETTAKVSGSLPLVPYRMLAASRPRTSAMPSPITTPMPVRTSPWRSTMPRIVRGFAPRAIRIPISCVRLRTA